MSYVGCRNRTWFKQLESSLYYLGWNRSPAQVGCMRKVLGPGALGRPRGIGWRGRWEGGSGRGIHVYPWLIHISVWQKPLQYCGVVSLQLIKKKKRKKVVSTFLTESPRGTNFRNIFLQGSSYVGRTWFILHFLTTSSLCIPFLGMFPCFYHTMVTSSSQDCIYFSLITCIRTIVISFNKFCFLKKRGKYSLLLKCCKLSVDLTRLHAHPWSNFIGSG